MALYGTVANASVGFKNKFINGNMLIWQRNTSKTGASNLAYESVDRWYPRLSYSGGTTNISRVAGPAGFTYAMRVEHAGSTATVASAWYGIRQVIEKANMMDLVQSSAMTLSFWYRSNRIGNHYLGADFKYGSSHTGTGPSPSSANGAFTVNAANTWEFKSITYTGHSLTDNTGVADNSYGAVVTIGFNGGEVAGVPTVAVGEYFEITGVQIEVGSVPTPFEARSVGQELALCQRYYQKSYRLSTAPGTAVSHNNMDNVQFSWGSNASGIAGGTVNLPVVMRASPTMTIYDNAGTSGVFTGLTAGSSQTNGVAPNVNAASDSKLFVRTYANSYNGMEWGYTVNAELT